MKNKQKTFSGIIVALIISMFFCFQSSLFSQWINISNIATTTLDAVRFLDANTGFTAGTNGIWRTTDGGYNWIHVLTSSKLNSIGFYDALNGMTVGDSGKIFRTTDNGVSWEQLNSGTSANLNSVSFAPPGYLTPLIEINSFPTTYFAYVVGQNGIFLRSFNSGSSWSVGSAFTQDLYFIIILPNYFGFTVGSSNAEVFEATANGGTYWQPILNTTNGGYHLFGGAFLTGQNTCIAVGSSGRIRRTTNWGLNWVLPVSNTTYDLYSTAFADANTGWLCGQYGFIERSTNGGFNWTQQFAPNYNNLRSMYFINTVTGWAVGDNGVVLRTDNGGITGVKITKEEVPKEFKLYQNYPNPFNPRTKIRFGVPEVSLTLEVMLIVCDIIGREVATLVNEKLEPGNYEVEFDGSNFTSGVYFYRLKSTYNGGKFTQTRKLILIK